MWKPSPLMSHLASRPIACLAPMLAALVATSAHASVTTSYWQGPAAGLWSSAVNWNPATVPSNAGKSLFDVVIDGAAQQSAVTLDLSAQIQNMWITGGDTLTIANNLTLALAGQHTTVDGLLLISSVGNYTALRLDADIVLGGSGTIEASNTTANLLYSSASNRLTIDPNLTIQGSLQLGANQLLLTNHGLVNANASGGLVIDLIDGGPNLNDGTLRASNGSVLTIATATLDNTDGVIEAVGASSVQLSGTSVHGGILRDTDGAGAGTVRNVGGCTLDGVTIEGEFNADNNTQTNLSSTINLQGPIKLNSVGNYTRLVVSTSPFSLAGAGGVVCSNTTANLIYGVAGDTRLIVPVEGSVRGSLQMGLNQLVLTNHGLINADVSGGLDLDLTDAGPNYNDGTLRASSGSTLNIHPTTIDNTGGVIEAAAGSTVQLNSPTIIGGILRDVDGPGAGSVRNVGTTTLDSVAIQGEFNCVNNTQTNLAGTIDLQGPIMLNSVGNYTRLVVSTSPFSLAGAGGVICSNTTANLIYGVAADTRLIIPAEGSVRGSVQLGLSQLLLTNHGLINADSSSSLELDLTDAGPNYNDGTIRASNGGTLNIQPTTINNSGGVIEASDGSFVQLNSAAIVGGILRDVDGTGPGKVRNVGNCYLTNTTIQGEFNGENNTITYLYGSINLQGTMKLNSVGNYTRLIAETTPFTLSGAGGTVCSNTTVNLIYSEAGAGGSLIIGNGHTLSGSFSLGLNSSGLRNEGTILADASSGISIDPADAAGFVNAGSLQVKLGNVSIEPGIFNNQGSVSIDAGRTLSRSGDYQQTAGSTIVNGVLSSSAPVTLLGGTLGGSGTVTAAVMNTSGNVAPGNSPGILSLSQGYTQQAGAKLTAEIGGAIAGTQFDCLAVTGGVALGGTLTVSRINGFVPTPGQTFAIIVCTGARTGTFSAVESCDPISVIYGTNSVSVQFNGAFGRVGDLNHDGLVNGADLGILLGSWGGCMDACCVGDINGDSIVNGADLGILLGNWG